MDKPKYPIDLFDSTIDWPGRETGTTMGRPIPLDAPIDRKEVVMPYNFKDVPIAECFKIDFFAMICKQCGATHPFYVNHLGAPSFITGLSIKAVDEFCETHHVSIEEVVENSCFICHCGFPIRFPHTVEEEEKIADNKEVSAKRRQRASRRSIVSPKLSIVSEAQARQVMSSCPLPCGEKIGKE